MNNKFYITTPIYYVNANPHIGHTYTTVAADVLARHHRMIGDKTFFLTGTDEHGAKIEEKAVEAGMDAQEFTDEVATQFKDAWKALDISNDRFIRTTEEGHKKAVHNALQYMFDKGDICEGKYEGLYCQGCEQFKNEKDLIDGLCPDHKTAPARLSEESYMFKLSKYQDILLMKIESDEYKIRPVEKKNEIVSFLKSEKLQDVSFSRKNVKWGIPIPWDKTHTTYVWADAFLNYLTGLGWEGKTPLTSLSKEGNTEVSSPRRDKGGLVFGSSPFQKGGKGDLSFWPADLQLMSKDILRVHATIWPAMLLSLDLPLPKELFVHGFFLINGQKMSKSLGNVISPAQLVEKYGVDGARYLLMSATSFGHDGDISWKWFDEKYNADLANGLGNLSARVSNLLEKNEIELELKSGSDIELIKKYNEVMNEIKLDEALKILWQVLKKNDEFLTAKAPWKMTGKEEIKNVLEPIAQDILNVAVLLTPYMPKISEKLVAQYSEKIIKKSESLFPRIS